MDPREGIQRQAKDAFLAVPGGKAALVIGTGIGKTRIALKILSTLITGRRASLILVPTERLRDNDWLKEIETFSPHIRDYVKIECYQTAYKWRDTEWEMVIADEWDTCLTPEYSKFFFTNKYNYLLALTAFIPEDKQALSDKLAPVCFRYSTQQGQADGIINKTAFYQVNFDLSNQKTIKVPMKGGTHFMQSENGAYEYLDKQFQKSLYSLSGARKKAAVSGLLGGEETMDDASKKAEWQFKTFARKRKELLHSLDSSAKVTKLLANKILETSTSKVLVFSRLIEQAKKISEKTFHSKNKNDEGFTSLSQFHVGQCRQLGVCEALNRGANIKGVNNIIVESYIGSEGDFQQRHGRGVRLDPSQTLNFFLLIPHVWIRAAVKQPNGSVQWQHVRVPTQANSWKERMTDSFDMSNIKTIEITQDRSGTYSLPSNYHDICSSS